MRDYWVTVCDVCRCAACWHGEFLCEESAMAGTVGVLASDLAKEDREHASNYSIEKLMSVCGFVRYVDGAG